MFCIISITAESSIEVDENGDEYEVKRFNIQGRQLNEGRSQCVVTRRKRASQPSPMYSDDGSNDEVDDKDDGDVIKGEEQQAMIYYSPPMVNPTGDDNDEEDKEGGESAMNMNEMTNDKEDGEVMEEKNSNEDMNSEDSEDYNGEDDNDTIEVIQLPQLPILGQLQSNGETVAAVASASGSAHAGYVSGHHANVGANGIMIVQSHTPPKVNPQTHAVFELVPANHAADDKDYDDDDNDNDIPDNFEFKEDINPVTTTAIWSTGDDNSNMNYDDLNNRPVKPQKLVKKVRKPVKANKKKKKSSLKPKRKNKYKYTYKRRLISGNKKRRNNKRRPYRTSVRRPTRRNKLRRGYTTRRGRPQRNRNQAASSKPTSAQHKNRNSNNSLSQKKNRGSNSKNKLIAKKQNNKKHAEIIDQGSNTFTRTMTMTQTGDEAGDKNVNCIIIRKDDPPTTPRPFWNVLGRSANGTPKASGHYGQRKRVNVRFVA
ncbi:uncharacterized protein LOC135958354 [Calliphora vicina]|uniref:uncharacterized protein LOC135958354 n=1 Tax=Calliphora vicina TaxID=7373 RepID=UPI00325AC99D